MIPAIILSLGMTFFPESPRWLVDHDREAEALEILADLHGGGDQRNALVVLEFEEIKEQVCTPLPGIGGMDPQKTLDIGPL